MWFIIFMCPHTGDFEQVPQLPLTLLLQAHQDLLALGHLLDHTLHLRQELHHALAAQRCLTTWWAQQTRTMSDGFRGGRERRGLLQQLMPAKVLGRPPHRSLQGWSEATGLVTKTQSRCLHLGFMMSFSNGQFIFSMEKVQVQHQAVATVLSSTNHTGTSLFIWPQRCFVWFCGNSVERRSFPLFYFESFRELQLHTNISKASLSVCIHCSL